MSSYREVGRDHARRRFSAGTAIMEFALAWPVVLVLVVGSVQLAVWGSEVFAARGAALAGARAGTVADAGADVASGVALRSLSAGLVGVTATAWCPMGQAPAPPVWVCAVDSGSEVQVDIGGYVPALVPLLPDDRLPLHAHVILQKEAFAR